MARKGTFGAYKEAYKNPPVDAAGAVTKQFNTEIARIDKKEAADKLAGEKKAKEDADRKERGVAAENKKLKAQADAIEKKTKANTTIFGKKVAQLADTQNAPPSAKAISIISTSQLQNTIENSGLEGIELETALDNIIDDSKVGVANVIATDEVLKKNKVYANDEYFNTFIRGDIDTMAAGNLVLTYTDKDDKPFPDNKPRWVGVDDNDKPVMLTNTEYQAQLVRNGEALDNAFNTEDTIVNGNEDAGILPLSKFVSANSITLDEKKDKSLFITEVRDRFAVQYGQNPIGAARDLYNNRKELKIPDNVATRFAELADDIASGVTVTDEDKLWYATTLSEASSTIADIFIRENFPKAFEPVVDDSSDSTLKTGSNTGINTSGGYVSTTSTSLNETYSDEEVKEIVNNAANGDLEVFTPEGGRVVDEVEKTVLLDKDSKETGYIQWDTESKGILSGDERTGSGTFNIGGIEVTFTDWNDFKSKLRDVIQTDEDSALHKKFSTGEYLVEAETQNQAANLNVKYNKLKASKGITFDVSKDKVLEIIQNGTVVANLDLNADYPLPKRVDFDTEQDFIDASNAVGKTREAAIEIQIDLLN